MFVLRVFVGNSLSEMLHQTHDLQKYSKTIEKYIKEAGYEFEGYLDRGGFGVLFTVRKESTNEELVMKIALEVILEGRKFEICQNYKKLKEIIKVHKNILVHREIIHILASKFHESDPKFDDVCIIIMDKAIGDLSKSYQEQVTASKDKKDSQRLTPSLIVQQMFEAVTFLNNHGIFHNDIKVRNFLLFRDKDGEYSVKLADFDIIEIFYDKEDMDVNVCNSSVDKEGELAQAFDRIQKGFEPIPDPNTTFVISKLKQCLGNHLQKMKENSCRPKETTCSICTIYII